MKHIIIGTAGHVDHGKTCLTRALTGVDTDRLKEEQKRGITIEIGFAQLTLPNGQTASIIDVPGHEKFIRNMLVGAAGMDVVLMVIAADEGFMPQTREHLGILSLLGVQNGIIVVTKADMVDEEWLEAIEEEARETVQGTFLQDAPILAVSSYTGQGIEELKELIVKLVEGAEQRNQDRPFRLPVDRVFSVDGFGTVVTGTLLEGSMQLGEEVCIYPSEKKARIRGLQNHDKAEERASAGMLNHVEADYYGCPTPINQISSITVVEGRQLVVKPYDSSSLKAIEQAINKSDLGLVPQNDGTMIRLNVPSLTEETRKDLCRKVSKMAEEAKVSVRNLRREANDMAKKDDSLTEDAEKDCLEKIQKQTDEMIKKIDGIAAEKEKEIMTI